MSDSELYKAPDADLGQTQNEEDDLASRGGRLGAAIIDMIILVGVGMGIGFMTGMVDFSEEQSLASQALLAATFITCYVLINGYLLHTNGQTVGKKALGIKVVNLDGSKATFANLLFVRYLVMAFVGYIPLIGQLAAFINPLFIFGEARRCIHDYLAGTKVINAD